MRASAAVHSTGGFGHSRPISSNARRSTRRSNGALCATRTLPWSSSLERREHRLEPRSVGEHLLGDPGEPLNAPSRAAGCSARAKTTGRAVRPRRRAPRRPRSSRTHRRPDRSSRCPRRGTRRSRSAARARSQTRDTRHTGRQASRIAALVVASVSMTGPPGRIGSTNPREGGDVTTTAPDLAKLRELDEGRVAHGPRTTNGFVTSMARSTSAPRAIRGPRFRPSFGASSAGAPPCWPPTASVARSRCGGGAATS